MKRTFIECARDLGDFFEEAQASDEFQKWIDL
jgi:hypothetical protein